MSTSKSVFTGNPVHHGTRSILCAIRLTISFSSKPQVPENQSFFTPLPLKDLALQFKHQIAGRKYLPGSGGKGLPKFLSSAREGFPFALRAESIDHLINGVSFAGNSLIKFFQNTALSYFEIYPCLRREISPSLRTTSATNQRITKVAPETDT